MTHPEDILGRFHPLVGAWFKERFGRPTDVQVRAWPGIMAGEHVLVTAPTGSGKTLAAFLWALDRLIAGEWPSGHTGVLYVSPLRALNNDIRRNLLEPLSEIRERFEAGGLEFPDIQVRTRSGDTPQSERRRMLRRPPEILITTPESLNLILSSPQARFMLGTVRAVILDEIHAVAGTKRGVHLITAVDRLVLPAGEFQRIGLSATVRPPEVVAEFLGGYVMEGLAPEPEYRARPVSVVRSREEKRYDLTVRFPAEALKAKTKESLWQPLSDAFRKIIGHNRSTLLFTNSRRLAEKITLRINRGEGRPLAYAHHGSLSREIREDVEGRLKRGELRAIVATNSLELGIDVGVLDEVILIQCPPSVSSAVQRIGRAGHRVGQAGRGTLAPTHAHDILEAAVMAEAVLAQDIEPIQTVDGALDVLAQILVSMVGVETWDLDELFARVRAGYPYRRLSRDHFDLVLNMLAGRYADSRVRELKPRLSIDRIDNTVSARKGALRALYLSGGVIPDRGYFHLRHLETNARIGELDEEYVWEASIGRQFTLGTQLWKIRRITHNDVFVVPGNPRASTTPFWRGQEFARDFHFSERIGRFLQEADQALDDPGFPARLESKNRMDQTAAHELTEYLRKQKEATGRPLPHRYHVLVEHVGTGPDGVPGNQVVMHTGWGLRVNRPLALALDAAWEERFGERPRMFAGNDCLVIQLPHEVGGDELLSLVSAGDMERLLRKRLEGSGFFGAHFRECAGRALLLTRDRFNRRLPLWMSRLRSQRLLEAVKDYDDFPILLEAWRTCLRDAFDLEALHRVLSELESGVIGWSEVRTGHPSPMARGAAWGQVNRYMYMSDDPMSERGSSLRSDLVHELLFDEGLRPAVDKDLAVRFEEKRMRLSPGYAPGSPRELLDWVKERRLIPMPEWADLLEAVRRDHGLDEPGVLAPIEEKLIRVRPHHAGDALVGALEDMGFIRRALSGVMDGLTIEPWAAGGSWAEPGRGATEEESGEFFTSFLEEWLRFYGPRALDDLAGMLGVDPERMVPALDDLAEEQTVVSGGLTKDGSDEVCDSENFEILLRLARREAVPDFQPLAVEYLPLFLSAYQGLTAGEGDLDALVRRLEQMLCLALPADMWEKDVLPARVRPYAASWLDTVFQAGDLRWTGRGERRTAFCFESDLDLLEPEGDGREPEEKPETSDSEWAGLFPEPYGRYDFNTLQRLSGLTAAEVVRQLWAGVWSGRVTNDSFMALRQGLENRFTVKEAAIPDGGRRGRRPSGRTRFSRWKGSRPSAGAWFHLPEASAAGGPMEREERNKDRVRLLLDRYGILFRELLAREEPAFRWPSIFRALILMELSGEILAGYFFHGIPGPQFMSHQAFRLLRRPLPEDAVFWLNATDPASPCGWGLEALKTGLPRRSDRTHLVYKGPGLMLISERLGKTLTVLAPPDDPDLPAGLSVLRHLLTRAFQPLRRIVIETINGEDAARSVYVDTLRTLFEVVIDHKHAVLFRGRE